jgi:hypothetical protein
LHRAASRAKRLQRVRGDAFEKGALLVEAAREAGAALE